MRSAVAFEFLAAGVAGVLVSGAVWGVSALIHPLAAALVSGVLVLLGSVFSGLLIVGGLQAWSERRDFAKSPPPGGDSVW